MTSHQIYLVTKWNPHDPPHEYKAFPTREEAEEYIRDQGGDLETGEKYTAPGGDHESFDTDGREKLSIRELEIESANRSDPRGESIDE